MGRITFDYSKALEFFGEHPYSISVLEVSTYKIA